MRISSFFLASAAALTVTGAMAADLPSKKAAPVQYVRVCSTYGEGFFYIPGTDTCIRIGGRVQFDYQYAQAFARGDSSSGLRSRGRIFLDARTATEYGLLRAFVRYDVARRTGNLTSGTNSRIGILFNGTGVDYNGNAQTEVDLNRAFVQFGGLTAGRTQSFFEFYSGDLEIAGTTAGSAVTTNLLAYTATFGTGFSATLALEDPIERRNVIQPLGANGRYAGSGMPDLVGVLKVEQGWGAAQLSGALHQVRAVGTLTPAGVVGAAPGFAPGTEYGFALNAGVQFNLPFAPGDQLWLQATYAKGASTYINSNPFGYGATFLYGVGGNAGLAMPDAFVVPNGGAGSMSLVSSWGLTAAVLHYWTPTIRQAVFGSYIKTDIPGNAYLFANGGPAPNPGNGVRDFSYWTIGTNVTWSPVKDLDIGAEINYVYAKPSNGPVLSVINGDRATRLVGGDSQIIGRFRIQRDF